MRSLISILLNDFDENQGLGGFCVDQPICEGLIFGYIYFDWFRLN